MAKGIITSREQRAQFDQAVKDVIKQRKTANAIQMAAREHKQLCKNGGPSNAQQAAQLQQNREKLEALIRTPEFAMLNGGPSDRKPARRNQSTHLSSSVISTQSTPGGVNQEGLQKLREQHPRRGANRRITVSGSSSNLESLELEAARRSSAPDQIGDNPRVARRRFSLDKSNSFSVLHIKNDDPLPSLGKKGMPRVGSEGYALNKMGDVGEMTLNSMGGGRGGLSKSMHPRNYTSGMSSSSSNSGGGMGHRTSSSGGMSHKTNSSSGRGGMKNSQSDGRLVPTYRPLSKTSGKVPAAAAAASSETATKENATWGLPSRKSTTQTAIATNSPHKVKTLHAPPGGEGCETYLSTSANSRKSPPGDLNEGLEEDDRKSSEEGQRGEFTKTISSSSRSGSGRISLSSRSGGIGAGALDLENIQEGDGSIISDSSPLGALSNGLGGIKLEELVPTRRKTRDISDGERPSTEKIDQWRNEDLILEPGGDFKMANTMGNPKKGDEELTFHDANELLSPSSTPSFHTANASSGEQDVNHNVCPREMLKLQAKSQSGGTGPTTGTSASSLVSSEGSFRKITPDHGKGNASTPDFEAIKEEVKDAGGGGDIGNMERRSSIENTERSELASGDSVEHIAGFSTYKNRRHSRMKKIRKSIKKTLMGTGGSMSPNNGEISSQGGTTISEEQQKRLSQHFQRKSSARSLMSANTSFSAVTTGSSATNSSQNSRWAHFRRKSVSMSNVMNSAVARNSSSRKDIYADRSTRSNVSNVSFLSDDGSGSKCSQLDFYDNSDHVRAVSSILSARSQSGRLVVSQLETVDEPSQWGEQKHDEDFLKSEKSAYHTYMENSSHCSDDTAPSFYRHPSHKHLLVHMRPNQLFPDSPGWQCDKCGEETFDLNVWAYISTEENYCLCASCFIVNGFVVDETA